MPSQGDHKPEHHAFDRELWLAAVFFVCMLPTVWPFLLGQWLGELAAARIERRSPADETAQWWASLVRRLIPLRWCWPLPCPRYLRRKRHVLMRFSGRRRSPCSAHLIEIRIQGRVVVHLELPHGLMPLAAGEQIVGQCLGRAVRSSCCTVATYSLRPTFSRCSSVASARSSCSRR